jgi:hypothetical protein
MVTNMSFDDHIMTERSRTRLSLSRLERLFNPQVEIKPILKIVEIGIENSVLVFTSGYQTICVSENGTFSVGQEIIFIHNDILVDTTHDIFSFVKEQIKKADIDKDGWYLVQTILIKGYYSDGIVLSLDTLTRYNLTLETLPIKKYSKPYEQLVANDEMTYTNDSNSQSESFVIPEFLNLRPGNFLERIIPKTEEINIKTYVELFKKIIKHPFYCTTKFDGSSMTILYDSVSKKFTICSRNLTLHELDNDMVQFVIKLIQEQNLVDKFDQLCEDLNCKIICVQGEYCGPKVNGNQMQLTSDDFYMFSVRIVNPDDDVDEDDISSLVPCRYKKHGNSQRLYPGYFLDYDQLIDFSQRTGIKMVPILDISLEQSSSLETLTEYCSQLRYTDFCVHMPNFAEGIVIRPKKIVSSEIFPQGFLSVKLLNPNYKIDPSQLAKTTKTKDQRPKIKDQIN